MQDTRVDDFNTDALTVAPYLSTMTGKDFLIKQTLSNMPTSPPQSLSIEGDNTLVLMRYSYPYAVCSI